LTAAGARGSQL